MNYEYIKKCFDACDEHINEGGGKITSPILAPYDIPNNIKQLIKDDYKLVKKIVEYHYKLSSYKTEVTFIQNKTNDKKTKVIEYNEIIEPWLKTVFVNKPKKVVEEPTNFIPNLDWCRPNQKESIKTSLNNKFISGIDLHATGGGKTFTILAKAYYYNQIYNKNVLLICERKYILNNEFANLSNVSKDIIDINKINIINVTTDDKHKYFYEKMQGTNNFVIVNRSAISQNDRFKQINKLHNFGLILIDECHSSSATKTFEILEYFKSLDCSLIGFSATPIRGSKIKKYISLFGSNNKINYLHNYSLFNAILDYNSNMVQPYGCLPFKIYLYDKQDKNPEKLHNIISNYINDLHYKKIIIWFREITTCTTYYEYFQNNKIHNIKNFISHNKLETNNDSDFIKSTSNCILFCVNRFREGTNLNTLELGVLLDSEVNRGDIPTIQMCGRLVRFDTQNIKTHGKVIDFCSKSNILEKIIKYYIDLTNDEKFYKIIEFITKNIEINKENKQINIKLSTNKKIELIFKSFEINWDTIKNELIEYVNNTFKYKIYRVPIGDKSNDNFNKTVKKLDPPIWGCKESLVSSIKTNDKLIFEIGNTLEIYDIIKVETNPDIGKKLWNDSIYSKILYLKYINSVSNIEKYKFLNKLIGYKELHVTRTICPITNYTESFIDWFCEQLNTTDTETSETTEIEI